MNQKAELDAIVSEYAPRLLGYIRSQVGNKEDAEDILQNVLYSLVRSVSDEDYGIERISAWLYRVARNSVLNFWRRRREYPMPLYGEEDEAIAELSSSLAASPADTPEALYLRSLVWQELDTALAELPAEQRDAFCLTALDGLSARDVAEATGVPAATVTSRKYLAVKHLRMRLHELYDAILTR